MPRPAAGGGAAAARARRRRVGGAGGGPDSLILYTTLIAAGAPLVLAGDVEERGLAGVGVDRVQASHEAGGRAVERVRAVLGRRGALRARRLAVGLSILKREEEERREEVREKR